MNPYTISLICLLLSAMFATLHQAFTIAGRVGLARLGERYPSAAERIRRCAPHWDRLRASLLLSHALTQAAALVSAAIPLFQRRGGALAGLFLAVIVLGSAFALDLLPQALSENFADRLSARFLWPVALWARLWTPLSLPLVRLEHALPRYLRSRAAERDRPTTEDEIISLVGEPRSDLDEAEREMIRGVFELSATVAREIMTPRVDMVALEGTDTVQEALRRAAEHQYSRYPIFHGSLDRIVGIVHIKDLALASAQGRMTESVEPFAKEALWIPETMRVGAVMKLMRSRREHMAIVVDEYGGTAGLLTMEDVIEEIVGEIRDEFDTEELDLPLPAGEVTHVDARMPIEEVNRHFALAVPESEAYDTIGGYLAATLGRVPRKGDVVDVAGTRLIVEQATTRRALRIRIERQR